MQVKFMPINTSHRHSKLIVSTHIASFYFLPYIDKIVKVSNSWADDIFTYLPLRWPGCIQIKHGTNCFTFYGKTMLLDVVLGPISAEEQVRVDDAPSVLFARYWRKINILICLWFCVWWKIDLMKPRLKLLLKYALNYAFTRAKTSRNCISYHMRLRK